ncbi:hypothetical protein A4X13_0g6013 [Tilletia indica]|uniref:DUF7918 domain-containing protein n=1 Tax=Tilletia indica TaxID=43049 RepID=A0A177THR1_9BASI|nr:hypothetical protein A4X13_0g6013 [Tilletia indica]
MSHTSSASSGPANNKTLYCDSFSAQILDGNGNPMRLYGIKREGRLVEAYLEAKEDEQFSVKVDSSDLFGSYSVRLELGGQWCESHLCWLTQWPTIIQGRQISESEAETLKFRRTAITDDEMHSIRDPAEVDRVGEISIKLRRVTSERPCSPPSFPTTALGPTKAICEKIKKLGALQFSAGPTVPSPDSPFVRCTYDANFLMIFKISCFTRFGLQLLGLIPSDHEYKRRREEIMEAVEKRLQNEINELRRWRRLYSGSEHSGMQASEASTSSVKTEPAEFDFSSGGTADNPLIIDDMSD